MKNKQMLVVISSQINISSSVSVGGAS